MRGQRSANEKHERLFEAAESAVAELEQLRCCLSEARDRLPIWGGASKRALRDSEDRLLSVIADLRRELDRTDPDAIFVAQEAPRIRRILASGAFTLVSGLVTGFVGGELSAAYDLHGFKVTLDRVEIATEEFESCALPLLPPASTHSQDRRSAATGDVIQAALRLEAWLDSSRESRQYIESAGQGIERARQKGLMSSVEASQLRAFYQLRNELVHNAEAAIPAESRIDALLAAVDQVTNRSVGPAQTD